MSKTIEVFDPASGHTLTVDLDTLLVVGSTDRPDYAKQVKAALLAEAHRHLEAVEAAVGDPE